MIQASKSTRIGELVFTRTYWILFLLHLWCFSALVLWMLYFSFNILEFLQYGYALHSSYFILSLILVLIMVKRTFTSPKKILIWKWPFKTLQKSKDHQSSQLTTQRISLNSNDFTCPVRTHPILSNSAKFALYFHYSVCIR